MERTVSASMIAAVLVLAAAGALPAAGADFTDDSVPRRLAGENTRFAMDLYERLSDGEGNLFVSPYSISSALAMTYAGARGDTRDQMASVLHFSMEDSTLHEAFSLLDSGLERGSSADGGFVMRSVNSLWGQEGYPFLPEFRGLLLENYDAAIELLDFSSDPESCREQINEFISGRTEGRIAELVPAGLITTATRLVLTNAIYFRADWLFQFEPMGTARRPFTLLDGTVTDVPTMTVSEHFPAARGDGWSAVELPYRDSDVSMLVILPDSGRFREIEDGLDAGFLQEVSAGLRDESLRLRFPRFETTSRFLLGDVLQSMGITDAFGPLADFSGMDGIGWLYISSVVHRASISVDEYGTEASAATGVIMAKLNGESSTEFSVDRPFIVLIVDGGSGTLLFMGRILDPRV